MGRAWGMVCAALSLFVTAGVARGGVIFTDYGAWAAAVAERGGQATALSLTPAVVPIAGGTFTDDELDLAFPENHGGIEIFADGWRGDVHSESGPHDPGPNLVTFHQPSIAFGALAAVGSDVGIDVDAINITIGGATHKLMRAEYDFAALAFWGWVGDLPVNDMIVSSGAVNHSYALRSVEWATLPEPSFAALVLAPAAWSLRRRRAAWR